jgi:hypothetical protein
MEVSGRFKPKPLYLWRRSFQNSVSMKFDGPQNLSGHWGEGIAPPTPQGSKRDFSLVHPIVYSQYRLSYPGSSCIKGRRISPTILTECVRIIWEEFGSQSCVFVCVNYIAGFVYFFGYRHTDVEFVLCRIFTPLSADINTLPFQNFLASTPSSTAI